MHVVFNESNPFDSRKELMVIDVFVCDFIDLTLEDDAASKPLELEGLTKEKVQEASPPKIELSKDWHYKNDHPKELILGETSKGVTTRSSFKPFINLAFISQIEPKSINEALKDEYWVLTMQEELNQFERNKVWDLVSRPKNHPIIGTKWVYRNKLDE